MNVNFRYIFEKKGITAPKYILKNNLWIDVGNIEKDGVFDPHQDKKYTSAFECIIKRVNCHKHLNLYLTSDCENQEVVVHIHEQPDIDCLLSIFVIKRMINYNKNTSSEVLNEKTTKVLIDYVNKINSGRGKCISKITLYAYFCKIGVNTTNIQERGQRCIKEGLELLELVAEKLENTVYKINLFETPLEEYLDVNKLSYYSELQANLQKISRGYQHDKKENRVILKSVNLWNDTSKSMKPVKAAIWEQLPAEEDEYIYARDIDNCLLTVYPYKIKEENSQGNVTRVVISLNPNLSEAAEFSLIPLAEAIEQYEQIEESLLYKKTQYFKRDHSHSRNGGRFLEPPFSKTADPWYVSDKGDIIDSPHTDSIIPYDRIISIIENASFMIKETKFFYYKFTGNRVDVEKIEEFKETSLGRLYKKTNEIIFQERQYLFALIKIDPSMLRYNNNWLKVCCLNMVGKDDSEFYEDNILQIGYRTCLYVDQSITILATTAEYSLSSSKLINDQQPEKSCICTDLKNILEHQLELRNIGKSLSETIQKITQKSEEIDSFNQRLILLNTKIEEDDLVIDPIEQEIYTFIKKILGIEKLKETVVTSAQLLIKNTERLHDRKNAEEHRIQEIKKKEEKEQEEKQNNRIQAGIGLVTIFTIFSAWNDAFDFITKFIPENTEGWSAVLKHYPVLIMEIIIAIFILFLGCIAGKFILQAWKQTSDKKNDDR